jgi:hypothetical protein
LLNMKGYCLSHPKDACGQFVDRTNSTKPIESENQCVEENTTGPASVTEICLR